MTVNQKNILVSVLIVVVPIVVFVIGWSFIYHPQRVTAVAPLIQQANLVYQGAFRLPTNLIGELFTYAGAENGPRGIAYNPANNSLFIGGNPNTGSKLAEINIPAVVNSPTLENLNVATGRQNFFDISEGNLGKIEPGGAVPFNGVVQGGLMLFNNKLIATSYSYYDADPIAIYSHFTAAPTFTAGSFRGMYQMVAPQAGFVAGYMTQIPTEWQSAFGGPALTGLCCTSIISRSSLGPAAFVFNPDNLGVILPAPATPVLYYNSENPTLGTFENSTSVNLQFNMTTQVSGVVFPRDSGTVLFFGRQGTGIPCYGTGTPNITLDRTPVPGGGGTQYCYDPSNSYQGTHAYPYKPWVWAYNANDMVDVKNGLKQPWEIRPYAVWDLISSFESDEVQGVGYDPATQTIYVSQASQELVNGEPQPVIIVFKINLPTSTPTPDTTVPSVPTGPTTTVISSSQINLSWNASTDNVGVTGYRIYRQGTQIGASTTTSYSSTGLPPSTTYSYTVAAYDAAGNVSAQSTSVSATTQAGPTPTPTPSPTPPPSSGGGGGFTPTLTRIPASTPAHSIPPDSASVPLAQIAQKIVILQAEISKLQNRLNELLRQQRQSSISCNFTRDLHLGLVGEDVRCLQKYLNSAGFLVASSGFGSLGNESTYFGPRTKKALIRWQQANRVVDNTGYFDSISKKKYLELLKKFR